MRAWLVTFALLALAGCNKSQQANENLDASEDLTAQNIVSNDITAIDAVTGADANMAADVDVNYAGTTPDNATDSTSGNQISRRASTAKPKQATKPVEESDPTATAATETPGNSE